MTTQTENLPATFRPSWEGLPGTNTLAHYKHSLITDVKVLLFYGCNCMAYTWTPTSRFENSAQDLS